jgi:hypothetical protein
MNDPHCKLLEGTLTYILQCCLGILSISTVYFKWRGEFPKREKKVVVFDVSKQVLGMGFAHLLNISIAIMMTKRITINDECRWYFLNFFVDILFGIPINYLLLKCINNIIKKRSINILETGSYTHSVSCCNKSYILQLFIWLFIVILSKTIILITILLPVAKPLNSFGRWLLGPVSNYPPLELTIVMVIFPLLFNIIQFWVQDSFLRGRKHYMDSCLIPDPDSASFNTIRTTNKELSSPLTEYSNL